jgi:hypothetical protein
MEWMGHRDLSTTLVYADFAPSTRDDLLDLAFAADAEPRINPRINLSDPQRPYGSSTTAPPAPLMACASPSAALASG